MHFILTCLQRIAKNQKDAEKWAKNTRDFTEVLGNFHYTIPSKDNFNQMSNELKEKNIHIYINKIKLQNKNTYIYTFIHKYICMSMYSNVYMYLYVCAFHIKSICLVRACERLPVFYLKTPPKKCRIKPK